VRVPPPPRDLELAASWAWRVLVCLLAVACLLALLWYLRVIVVPAMVALTLAPVLTPIASLLRRHGIRRLAPGIALTTGIVVVAGLGAIVTSSVAAEYEELASAVSDAVTDITGWLEGEPFNLSGARAGDLDSSLGAAWREGSGYLVAGIRTGVGLLAGLILALALLYFVLRDGEGLWNWTLRRVSPALRPSIDRAGRSSWQVLAGFIRGTVLIALIDATLIGIGLWILGVPLVFPLAVLVFLGSFVPFVGATISGMIAVLVAFADGGWVTALIALGIILGVQFLEGNFLQPIIQSRTVDLHPAVILLAVAAGGSLFGVLGAYLAVPVAAVAVAMTVSLRSERALVRIDEGSSS
jgi:predicted PurR-regulated permease PerM